MKKLLGILFFYSILVVLLLPLVVTLLCGGFSKAMPQQAKVLYGTADLAPLKSELEEYVVGVVAAEMPAAFPEEALKAQAVAARTYQVRQMQAAGTKEVLYDVGQAYIDTAEQKKKWGENYPVYASKIRKAVRETAGEIMVYDGEPILAAFHAISAGRTEDAVHVWNNDVPYLKSVDSREDAKAPQHETTVIFSEQELEEKLGSAEVYILSRTDAGYVSEVRLGEKILSGREVREKLGLRSTNFTIEKKDGGVQVTTHGYGHGVGMSQYGASFLAEKGKTYHEILRHYYQGIDFQKME
ncbi:stage II sporulation protein D [Anaerotignum sp.]